VRGVQQQLQRMANSFSGVEIRKQADLVSKYERSIRCLPMYSEVLREVRAALAETRMKSERVDALLADPATLKAIDRTLEQLG
jgi:hypothetical protein